MPNDTPPSNKELKQISETKSRPNHHCDSCNKAFLVLIPTKWWILPCYPLMDELSTWPCFYSKSGMLRMTLLIPCKVNKNGNVHRKTKQLTIFAIFCILLSWCGICNRSSHCKPPLHGGDLETKVLHSRSSCWTQGLQWKIEKKLVKPDLGLGMKGQRIFQTFNIYD